MVFEGRYVKRFKLHRETANAFVSCRRFVKGSDGPAVVCQEKFLSEAIQDAFQSSEMAVTLKSLCNGNRVNGCVDANIPISKKDWYDIQDFLGEVAKLTEGDIIQFCLEFHMKKLKEKGIV